MNPNMQINSSPDETNYEFIDETPLPPQRKGFLANTSKRGRILIAAVTAISLLGIFAFVFGFVLKDRDPTTPNLISVAETQNELIRIADLGIKESSKSSEAQIFAVNTKQTIQTDQQALLAVLAARHAKIPKNLSGATNSRTDQKLSLAKQSNTYEEVFTGVLVAELTKYQKQIKTSYEEATSTKAKNTLANNYDHATLLISNKPAATR